MRAEILKAVKDGSIWKKEIVKPVCERCEGLCCYNTYVLLDRESVERKLHLFKGFYSYKPAVVSPILSHLGRKRVLAPVLSIRKDGSCVFLDKEAGACTIYERRPYACRTFFCGRGTRNSEPWKRIKLQQAFRKKKKKRKEVKMETKAEWDRNVPILDALLEGQKLWNSGAPAFVQKGEMRKLAEKIRKEHEYLCKYEPPDQFHACVLLGALNLLEGALSKKKVLRL